MSLPVTVPNAGVAASAVVAGLYLLSLFLTALTSRPPSIDNQDAPR